MFRKLAVAAIVALVAGSPAFADKLTVKFLTGKTLELEVKPTDTIQAIKQLVQDKEGIEPGLQRFIYAGKPLEDAATLKDTGLTDGASLFVVLRTRGG